MSKIILYSVLALLFVATSCYYDSEEALYPTVITIRNCDTATITYTGNILPIISGKCNTCHSVASSSSSGGNIVLEGYANLQKVAASGKLLGAITYASGYSQMPKNANKLSYCEITVIRRWIESNTPNN